MSDQKEKLYKIYPNNPNKYSCFLDNGTNYCTHDAFKKVYFDYRIGKQKETIIDVPWYAPLPSLYLALYTRTPVVMRTGMSSMSIKSLQNPTSYTAKIWKQLIDDNSCFIKT